MNTIALEDLKRSSDPGSFARGVKYFSDGRVLSLQVDAAPPAVKFFATVAGSEGNIYEQSVEVRPLGSRHLDVLGECTCPVGYNCKHVIAACLQYNRWCKAPQHRPPNYWLEWLDQFAAPPREKALAEGGEFVAYVLREDAQHGGVMVQLLLSRVLRRGGFGKGKRLDLADIYYHQRRLRSATSDDVALTGLLAPLQRGHGEWISLRGELGALALQHMVASERCFWESLEPPALHWAAARPAHLVWEQVQGDNKRLRLVAQPAAIVLPTVPALYLDPQARALGPLQDAQFSEEQWQLLQRAPIVPAAQINDFSRRMLAALPAVPLAPPEHLKLRTLRDLPPRPWLSVQGRVAGPCLQLQFAYDQTLLPAWPQEGRSLRDDGAEVVIVVRDTQAEQAAVERLRAAGFAPRSEAPGGETILLPTAGDELAAIACWQNFLHTQVAQLRSEGWQVSIAEDFPLRFHDAGDWAVEVEDGDNDWFALRFDLEIDGRKIPLLPVISQVLAHYEPEELPEQVLLPVGAGDYVRVPGERIRSVCQVLYELHEQNLRADDGALLLSRFDTARLGELREALPAELPWQGGEKLLQLAQQLRDFSGIAEVAPPAGLQAVLRAYQLRGLSWLQFLRQYEFGGILADDMGLGKTLQTLAHLLLEKNAGRMDRPCLIVAPTSLMANWRREAQQFTPGLRVLVLQGMQRHRDFSQIRGCDLVLTTYPLLTRDEEVLAAVEFHCLILDEAQYIKNPKAKSARVVRRLRARHRLCLTGTPMENHLGELWAQFDFLMPGLLGSESAFARQFRTPIEKYADLGRRERLVRKLRPFMLRRSKAQVATELPPKTEILRSVTLGSRQAALYESIRLAMEQKVRQAIASKGLARSHIMVLDALLKLRQTCCDPRLLSLAEAGKVRESAKLEMLMELLPALLEEGRRVLLFSQFARMLALIEEQLQERQIKYCKLTGQTRDRENVIDKFRSGAVSLFLISLKAGGVGLNLTEADTVIHYDPWWNPAAENQATDRAHRIGQDKPVFVYKLITENTVEEKILAMQARKHALAMNVYDHNGSTEPGFFTADDLALLFAPDSVS